MANRFYANRMAIKAISEKEGVDVDIALPHVCAAAGLDRLGKGNGRVERYSAFLHEV